MTLFKTSRKTNVVVELPFGAQERNAFDHLFGGPVPVGTEKAEGSVHCPRAPTQEPSKGLRPHNRHSQKRKVKRSWCPVVACPGWPGWGFFPGLVSLVLFSGPCVFLSVFSFSVCFFPLAAGVTFQLPDGRDVGSNARAPTQEPVEAPTQEPAFSGIPLPTPFFCTSSRLSCSSSSCLLLYF